MALLQVGILEPRQRVEVLAPARQVLLLRQIHCGLVRHNVRRHDVVPHPELNEDMRRHVQRVGSRRGDLRVGAGRGQREDGMVGIVERVDDEVRRARVFRIALEDVLGNRRRLHRGAHRLLARPRRPEKRQRIERRNLVIARVLLVQSFHRRGIGDVARVLVARAEQHVDRLDEPSLAACRRLCGAPGRGRCQPLEHPAGRSDILLRPQRMVVAHRFAPVGEREPRIALLRLAEGLGGRVELEIVQRFHPDEKSALRRAFRRRRKVDGAELAGRGRLGAGRRGPNEIAGDDQGDE